MRDEAILSALARMEPGAILRFRFSGLPLDELLLAVHESRFTGAVAVGEYPSDQIFMRDGAVVGVATKKYLHAQLLGQVLMQQKSVERAALERVLDEEDVSDGTLLGQRMLSRGIVSAEDLDRACAEQARRRLFQLYDLADAPVVVSEGISRLAHFHPAYVDVRPAIAFGMVARSSRQRRAEVIERVRGRSVRFCAPYDEFRNSYGLPPPVLQGIRCLAEGEVVFGLEPTLPGLGPEETSGVLLLFDRMRLLEIVR